MACGQFVRKMWSVFVLLSLTMLSVFAHPTTLRPRQDNVRENTVYGTDDRKITTDVTNSDVVWRRRAESKISGILGNGYDVKLSEGKRKGALTTLRKMKSGLMSQDVNIMIDKMSHHPEDETFDRNPKLLNNNNNKLKDHTKQRLYYPKGDVLEMTLTQQQRSAILENNRRASMSRKELEAQRHPPTTNTNPKNHPQLKSRRIQKTNNLQKLSPSIRQRVISKDAFEKAYRKLTPSKRQQVLQYIYGRQVVKNVGFGTPKTSDIVDRLNKMKLSRKYPKHAFEILDGRPIVDYLLFPPVGAKQIDVRPNSATNVIVRPPYSATNFEFGPITLTNNVHLDTEINNGVVPNSTADINFGPNSSRTVTIPSDNALGNIQKSEGNAIDDVTNSNRKSSDSFSSSTLDSSTVDASFIYPSHIEKGKGDLNLDTAVETSLKETIFNDMRSRSGVPDTGTSVNSRKLLAKNLKITENGDSTIEEDSNNILSDSTQQNDTTTEIDTTRNLIFPDVSLDSYKSLSPDSSLSESTNILTGQQSLTSTSILQNVTASPEITVQSASVPDFTPMSLPTSQNYESTTTFTSSSPINDSSIRKELTTKTSTHKISSLMPSSLQEKHKSLSNLATLIKKEPITTTESIVLPDLSIKQDIYVNNILENNDTLSITGSPMNQTQVKITSITDHPSSQSSTSSSSTSTSSLNKGSLIHSHRSSTELFTMPAILTTTKKTLPPASVDVSVDLHTSSVMNFTTFVESSVSAQSDENGTLTTLSDNNVTLTLPPDENWKLRSQNDENVTFTSPSNENVTFTSPSNVNVTFTPPSEEKAISTPPSDENGTLTSPRSIISSDKSLFRSSGIILNRLEKSTTSTFIVNDTLTTSGPSASVQTSTSDTTVSATTTSYTISVNSNPAASLAVDQRASNIRQTNALRERTGQGVHIGGYEPALSNVANEPLPPIALLALPTTTTSTTSTTITTTPTTTTTTASTTTTTTAATPTTTPDWCYILCQVMQYCSPTCVGHVSSWNRK